MNRFRTRETAGLGRRELLQGFGLTAAAAVASHAFPGSLSAILRTNAQAGKASAAPFTLTTVNHLSLAVSNYARSRDFYVDLLGMRVVFDDGKRCALEFGSRSAPNGMYLGGLAGPGAKPVVNHIAFGIPDFWARRTAIQSELERRGVRVRADGQAGWTFDEPARFMTPGMQVTPEKDQAMYPGADRPCTVAASESCKLGWQQGQKLVASDPKPSGKGFQAIAFRHIVFEVPDVRKECDFYTDLWGMKVISESLSDANRSCLLGFGENTLMIRDATSQPGCRAFGFAIANFDHAAVETELRRRRFTFLTGTTPDSSFGIKDPDGFSVEIAPADFFSRPSGAPK